MEHFWDTVDTIGEGFGFSLFGARHLVTLALYIGFAALSCKLYKAADEKKRAQLRGLFAVLLLADEAFKQIGLQIGGNFNWDYLPLHLCSINIFLIALYAWKPRERRQGGRAARDFPYRAVRMEAEQAARQFSLFYLYPRGDGGTAVPDVDVASGGELHVLAFDERAHSACCLSHHAVFGR